MFTGVKGMIKIKVDNHWFELHNDINEMRLLVGDRSIQDVRGLHSLKPKDLTMIYAAKSVIDKIPPTQLKQFCAFLSLYYTSPILNLNVLTLVFLHTYIGKFHSKIDFLSYYLSQQKVPDDLVPYLDLGSLLNNLFSKYYDGVKYGNFLYVFQNNMLGQQFPPVDSLTSQEDDGQ